MHVGRAAGLPPPSTSVEVEGAIIFRLCAVYHLALSILVQLKTYESASQQKTHSVFLSCVLALLPLLPRHKKVCLRMGIRENASNRNFGVSSLLTTLLWPSSTQSEHNTLVEVLQTCEKHQNKNIDFSRSNLPSSRSDFCLASLSSSLSSNACHFAGRPIVSFLSLKMLREEWVECGWCSAGFLPLECALGERCPVCQFGKIQQQNFLR